MNDLTDNEIHLCANIINKSSAKSLIEILDRLCFDTNLTILELLEQRLRVESWDEIKKLRGFK